MRLQFIGTIAFFGSMLVSQDARSPISVDSDPSKRVQSITEFNSSSDDAVARLLTMLEDPNAFVRDAARTALRRMGRSSVTALLNLAHSPSKSTQFRAVNDLMEILTVNDATLSDLHSQILEVTRDVRCLRDAVCLEKWVKPNYPPLAHVAAIEGKVWASFQVNETGSVKNVSVDGSRLLGPMVLETLGKWQFSGNDGRPFTYAVMFEFQITDPYQFSRQSVAEMAFPWHVVVTGARLSR